MRKLPVWAATAAMVMSALSACSSDERATDVATCGDWSPIGEQPEETAMPAGCYGLDPATDQQTDLPVAVLKIPADYARFDTWLVLRGTDRSVAGNFRGVAYLAPLTVYADPCHNDGKPKKEGSWTPMDPGPTVQDLADAMRAQKGAITTSPEPASLDGYEGVHFDYRVDLDIDSCGDKAFDIYPGYYLQPGRNRFSVWILDVEGQRVVIGWSTGPSASADEQDEVAAIVESASFVVPRT